MKNTSPTRKAQTETAGESRLKLRGRPRAFTSLHLFNIILREAKAAHGGYQISTDSLRRKLRCNRSTVQRHLSTILERQWLTVSPERRRWTRRQVRIAQVTGNWKNYNYTNIYRLGINAPQGLNILKTKSEKPGVRPFLMMPEAKRRRSTYKLDWYLWNGERMRRERRLRNNPPRTSEGLARLQRSRKFRELLKAAAKLVKNQFGDTASDRRDASFGVWKAEKSDPIGCNNQPDLSNLGLLHHYSAKDYGFDPMQIEQELADLRRRDAAAREAREAREREKAAAAARREAEDQEARDSGDPRALEVLRYNRWLRNVLHGVKGR